MTAREYLPSPAQWSVRGVKFQILEVGWGRGILKEHVGLNFGDIRYFWGDAGMEKIWRRLYVGGCSYKSL